MLRSLSPLPLLSFLWLRRMLLLLLLPMPARRRLAPPTLRNLQLRLLRLLSLRGRLCGPVGRRRTATVQGRGVWERQRQAQQIRDRDHGQPVKQLREQREAQGAG